MKVLPEVNELEFVERHAPVDLVVLRRLLVQFKRRLPLYCIQRRNTTGHDLPARDAQAAACQSRDAADHNLQKDHDKTRDEPQLYGAGNAVIICISKIQFHDVDFETKVEPFHRSLIRIPVTLHDFNKYKFLLPAAIIRAVNLWRTS